MRDPESLDFSPTDIASETIEQFYFTVDPEKKFELLERLLKREEPRQAIIFCRKDGLDHGIRDFIQGDRNASLLAKLGD